MSFKYCISSDMKHYSANMRFVSEILSKRGFDSKMHLVEDTDFDYSSDKPLDEDTIKAIKNLPGIERVIKI